MEDEQLKSNHRLNALTNYVSELEEMIGIKNEELEELRSELIEEKKKKTKTEHLV